MANLIEGSGAKDNDKIKLGLLANKFYEDNKVDFDLGKVSANIRIKIMAKFILFTVQFETIVIKASKPLSGIGNASDEIIRLYQEKQKGQLMTKALK